MQMYIGLSFIPSFEYYMFIEITFGLLDFESFTCKAVYFLSKFPWPTDLHFPKPKLTCMNDREI